MNATLCLWAAYFCLKTGYRRQASNWLYHALSYIDQAQANKLGLSELSVPRYPFRRECNPPGRRP